VMRSRRDGVVVAEIGDQRPVAPPEPAGRQRCFLDGEWREVPYYQAADLAAGAVIEGPALIQQAHSALVVPARWRVHGLGGGGVRLRAAQAGEERPWARWNSNS
jgi:N-methylhydantoinase A/oxoprolinase/acetone carboxylase beta subunit